MSQSIMGEGTKIAQAAKDLNVTSVTVRRYLSEFNVPTTSDDSGIMVLPPSSVAELSLIRKLKEDSLGNEEILEMLATHRQTGVMPVIKREHNGDERPQNLQENLEVKLGAVEPGESTSRPRHTLTCQTCGKSFEHTNPRLRDCLDCYRSKRKERRVGTPRVVIQHPLAKLAANKTRDAATLDTGTEAQLEIMNGNGQNGQYNLAAAAGNRILRPIRNYRKAVDETRHITGNLKRRLDRADLPDGERKWLEQIYAYQLILHQGWRHLQEYRSMSSHQPQAAQAAESSQVQVADNES